MENDHQEFGPVPPARLNVFQALLFRAIAREMRTAGVIPLQRYSLAMELAVYTIERAQAVRRGLAEHPDSEEVEAIETEWATEANETGEMLQLPPEAMDRLLAMGESQVN